MIEKYQDSSYFQVGMKINMKEVSGMIVMFLF